MTTCVHVETATMQRTLLGGGGNRSDGLFDYRDLAVIGLEVDVNRLLTFLYI